MGAPGLAFETWDPRNRFEWMNRPPLVIQSGPTDGRIPFGIKLT